MMLRGRANPLPRRLVDESRRDRRSRSATRPEIAGPLHQL